MTTDLTAMGQAARAAARGLARADNADRCAALETLAAALLSEQAAVLAANAADVAAAHANGLTEALIDRLTLTPARLTGMAADLRAIVGLPDPVGEVFDARTLPNGLRVQRQRVPIGVLGVIYESRPNVTIDVAGLAIRTGNAAVLRGGKETLASNRALVALVQAALQAAGLPGAAVQFIDDADRRYVTELLRLHHYVDMIIPRGGAALHTFCRENATIPVITGGMGICHLYVDASADLARALPVIRNAKVQRPSVCNALDTVLVHQAVAAQFLRRVVSDLGAQGVTFRAEPRALAALGAAAGPSVQPAGPEDFDTEWMALILGLKVVDGLDEAIAHIAAHTTAHSDGILTETPEHAERFVAEVDSAAVYVNASTRFTDGAQLGLGAEVAVSTQRLHARGPMGLPELTTYKWVVRGDYTART
ncbi:MAG: glutamate-5-semialdehyde dehydrogenase [Anaerolineales bacterium]|nr:glutamate-5-semialdehyde dehydrogenase [Anaerolineales bacterium]